VGDRSSHPRLPFRQPHVAPATNTAPVVAERLSTADADVFFGQDLQERRGRELGAFAARPVSVTDIRCDLHPRGLPDERIWELTVPTNWVLDVVTMPLGFFLLVRSLWALRRVRVSGHARKGNRGRLCEGTRWQVRTVRAYPAVDPYPPLNQAAVTLTSEQGMGSRWAYSYGNNRIP